MLWPVQSLPSFQACPDCFQIVGASTREPPHAQLELQGTTFFGMGFTGRETNAVYRFQCLACNAHLLRDRNPEPGECRWALGRDSMALH